MTHTQAVAMAYRTKPDKRKIPVAFSVGYLATLINSDKKEINNEKP